MSGPTVLLAENLYPNMADVGDAEYDVWREIGAEVVIVDPFITVGVADEPSVNPVPDVKFVATLTAFEADCA